MGAGFVILLHLIAVLILSVVTAVIATILTAIISNREKKTKRLSWRSLRRSCFSSERISSPLPEPS